MREESPATDLRVLLRFDIRSFLPSHRIKLADSTTPCIAVAGCGPWGMNLIRTFAQLKALGSVIDIDTTQVEESVRKHNVVAQDWHSALRDSAINAVALATPAQEHAAMAIEALDAGKHVFIEKPLALSLDDGNRVLTAARKSGKIVMVGHVFQYHPAFRMLRSWVHEDKLGRLHYIDSTRFGIGRVRHDENALWSLDPHDISMILSLTGEIPATMDAKAGYYLGRDIADTAHAHLTFASGVEAHVHVSWLHPEKQRELVVVGDQGMAVFDDCLGWDRKLQFFHHTVAWRNLVPQHSPANVEVIKIEEQEPLMNECSHFIRCIRDNVQPITHVDEGLLVLRVLAGFQKTMEKRQAASLASSPRDSLVAGDDSIHKTVVVDEDCIVGSRTRIWHFTHVMKGARIGHNCIIGQNVMIGEDVRVGDCCKIQNNVSVYKGVQLEDGVFCGPSCVFTNVLTPRAEVERKSEFLPTTVHRGATIGANATVVCGDDLGEYCMVGAGAVVTKPVPPYALVIGNPSKQIGWVSAAGERLGLDLVCPRTGSKYKLKHLAQLIPDAATCSDMTEHRQSPPQGILASATIPFVDLKKQRDIIRESLDRRIAGVVDSANFVMGPEVTQLEEKLATYTGAAHVISCANGTDALTLALMALQLRPGDAVLVPRLTFVATVEPVALLGGTAVFLDVEPESLNIDPSLIDAGVRAALKAGCCPVGIIAVDLYGQPADYDALHAAATVHNLWVVVDAAQSFGGSLNGRKVGTLAKITTTSFFPSKPLECYEDGGAVPTDDSGLAAVIRSLHLHGRGVDKFDSVRVGINSRLDTLQAAVLLSKLEVFGTKIDKRQEVAARYTRMLAQSVTLPVIRKGAVSAWASYTVRTKDREAIREHLLSLGIPTGVYYPQTIHRQAAYQRFPVANGTCPVADMATTQVLSLPLNPYLNTHMQRLIVENKRLKCSTSVMG